MPTRSNLLQPRDLVSDDEDDSIELRAEESLTSLDLSDPTNSYEDEPWVAKYSYRKGFEPLRNLTVLSDPRITRDRVSGRGSRSIKTLKSEQGISTPIAAVKGMCIVLHRMHHRHFRPRESCSEDVDSSVELRAEEPLTSLDSSESLKS